MTDPAPPPATPAGTAPRALLLLRFAAALYDLFPLLPIWFFTAAICLGATRGTLDYHAWWYRGVLLLVTAAYFVLSWVRGGQTIGLKAWRLQVVRSDGKPLDVAHASLRFGVALLSLGLVGVGFFAALLDPQRRSWHDRAAGTRMQRLPKR